jgi:hypothetical protein
MRVFSIGLRSSVYPRVEAGPLKGQRSRWTGIPRYVEHRESISSGERKRGRGRSGRGFYREDYMREGVGFRGKSAINSSRACRAPMGLWPEVGDGLTGGADLSAG